MRLVMLALVVVVLAPMSARADDGDPAFRIGGGLNLLTWNAVTTALGGTPQETDTLAIGLVTPSLVLDVGALVTPWLALGLVGQAVYSYQSASSALSYRVLAYAEGSWRVDFARPFARVYAGVAGVSSELSTPGIMGTTASVTTVQGALGAGLGAHLFATSDFSISPYFDVLYFTGETHQPSATFSSTTISLQLGVSFLGWID